MAIDERLVKEWQVADAALKIAKERFDKITNELAQEMLVQQIKSDLVRVHGDDFKVTVIQSETVKIDEDSLLKDVGKRSFNKFCVQKIDRKLLEKGVIDGTLSAETLARHTVVAKSKPYIKVTRSTEEPE